MSAVAGTGAGAGAVKPDKYVYMTQPWVASFYYDCDNSTTGVLDWRNKAGTELGL